MSWKSRAACRGVERRVMYPEDNGFEVATPEWVDECNAVIRRYCLTCPVRLECFASAQEDEGDASRGIWGGVHFVDRRRMRDNPVRCRHCPAILDPLVFIRTDRVPQLCPEHYDV